MFQDDPLTGLLFLVGDRLGLVRRGRAGNPHRGTDRVVTATLVALWLRVDRPALNAGLYGYNGVLVGLALATFIAPGPLLWAYVVLGAAVSVVATLGTANALKPFGVAALTFPFVIVTWLLLLATYGFSGLSGSGLPAAAVITPFEPAPGLAPGPGDFVTGVVHSISQVFLKGSGVAGLLLLAGLAVELALGGGVRARGRDPGGRDRPSLRRGERSHRRRPPRLQSGPDRDRARRHVPPSRAPGRGLCGARRRSSRSWRRRRSMSP